MSPLSFYFHNVGAAPLSQSTTRCTEEIWGLAWELAEKNGKREVETDCERQLEGLPGSSGGTPKGELFSLKLPTRPIHCFGRPGLGYRCFRGQ